MVVRLENDLKKFDAAIRSFQVAVGKLKSNDKRAWEVAFNAELLQENLETFKTSIKQIVQLKKVHKSYQDAVVQIYTKFMQDHDKEIKQKKKSDVLQQAVDSLYLERFSEEDNQLFQLEIKAYKEFEIRIEYTNKLTKSLQANENLKAVAAEGKKVLSLSSENILEIKEQLKRLSKLSQQTSEIKNFVTDNLKQLLAQ